MFTSAAEPLFLCDFNNFPCDRGIVTPLVERSVTAITEDNDIAFG